MLRTALRRHTETLLAARHSTKAALKDPSQDNEKGKALENAAAPGVAVAVNDDDEDKNSAYE